MLSKAVPEMMSNDVAQNGRWWQKRYNIAIWYWTELSSNRLQTYSYEPLGSTSVVCALLTWLLWFLRVKIYCVDYILSSLCMWEQWRVGDFCFQWQTRLVSLVGGSLWIDGSDQVRKVKSLKFRDGKRYWKIKLVACWTLSCPVWPEPPPPII